MFLHRALLYYHILFNSAQCNFQGNASDEFTTSRFGLSRQPPRSKRMAGVAQVHQRRRALLTSLVELDDPEALLQRRRKKKKGSSHSGEKEDTKPKPKKKAKKNKKGKRGRNSNGKKHETDSKDEDKKASNDKDTQKSPHGDGKDRAHSGKTASKSEHQGKAEKLTVSCQLETALRRAIASSGHLPTLLRFLFHDSVDEDNLMLLNNKTGFWEKVADKNGKYGGLDGCLYSTLKGPAKIPFKRHPHPGHNRQLPNFIGFAEKTCRLMCRHSKAGICKSHDNCVVDVGVLGSFHALERESGGGAVGTMSWGRRKGDCTRPVVTPFSKDKHKIKSYSSKPALGFAPMMKGMEKPEEFRSVFKRLGFSEVDQAALMGAHSFGKVRPCADGLNGVEYGPFCKKPEMLVPPINISNIIYAGNKDRSMGNGDCKPKAGVVNNCWKQTNIGMQPMWIKMPGRKLTKGFGDGGFWDTTPMKFDNDYYKLFAHEEFKTKDVCCGKVKSGLCHRTGSMVRILKRDKAGKSVGKTGSASACGVSWCRSDRKGRQHMKSTKAWHEPPPSFLKKATLHGTTLRMVRLPGDWALLHDSKTRAAVKLFAKDEKAWFKAFVEAWAKVTNKGYKHGELKTCDPTPSPEIVAQEEAQIKDIRGLENVAAGKARREAGLKKAQAIRRKISTMPKAMREKALKIRRREGGKRL